MAASCSLLTDIYLLTRSMPDVFEGSCSLTGRKPEALAAQSWSSGRGIVQKEFRSTSTEIAAEVTGGRAECGPSSSRGHHGIGESCCSCLWHRADGCVGAMEKDLELAS